MGRRGSGRHGGGRRRRVEPADVVQSTEKQIKIDFTIEQKAEAFDEAGALWAQIQVHKEAAAGQNKARRLLEKKLSALQAEAAAGKRTITVEVEERPDFEAGVVTTHRLATGEQLSERAMTEAEKDSGVVLTGRGLVSRIGPQDAKNILGEVAAHIVEAHPEGGFQITVTSGAPVAGNGHDEGELAPSSAEYTSGGADFTEEEYPRPSTHPADVAAVREAAQA